MRTHPNFKSGSIIRLKSRGKNALKQVPILEYEIIRNNPDEIPEINLSIKSLFYQPDVAIFVRFANNNDHRKWLRRGMIVYFQGELEIIEERFVKHFKKL